jgi:hypothetical protein
MHAVGAVVAGPLLELGSALFEHGMAALTTEVHNYPLWKNGIMVLPMGVNNYRMWRNGMVVLTRVRNYKDLVVEGNKAGEFGAGRIEYCLRMKS